MRKNISKLEKLDSKFLFVTPSEVTGIILFPENTERNERERQRAVSAPVPSVLSAHIFDKFPANNNNKRIHETHGSVRTVLPPLCYIPLPFFVLAPLFSQNRGQTSNVKTIRPLIGTIGTMQASLNFIYTRRAGG